MKTIKHISLWVVVATCMVAVSTRGNAQAVSSTYFNVDWQFNAPVGNSYADKASGWGMNFEGGYYVMPKMAIGAFISYHTNNKYIDRQTLSVGETSAITSDQQHSLFQLPFGAAFRYSFTREGLFEPYVSAKLGTEYSEMSTYMNVMKVYDRQWGFYVAPEVGMNIFFTPEKKFGLHVAAYYNYATNKSKVLTYSMDGINNWGVRFGVAF